MNADTPTLHMQSVKSSAIPFSELRNKYKFKKVMNCMNSKDEDKYELKRSINLV